MAKTLEAAEDVTQDDYKQASFPAPTLTGGSLLAFLTVLESPLGAVLYPSLAAKTGVSKVLNEVAVPEGPTFTPALPIPTSTDLGCIAIQASISPLLKVTELLTEHGPEATGASKSFRPSVRDYHTAYVSGSLTPLDVAENIITFVNASERSSTKPRPARWFISFIPEDVRAQATASAARYKAGKPLSILDGVPFAVKDVLDALPHPTTAGTAYFAKRRSVSADAPYVAALRAAGAVLLGKSNMHEIGLGVTGLNTVTGTALNPVAPGHYIGGSSSGSAAVLAAGLCPIAIGTDGGGSVRIPASFGGLVGLKPTQGRVSGRGGIHVDFTVSTAGPMAGSVEDVMLAYAVMANVGVDPEPSTGLLPPPPTFPSPYPRLQGVEATPLEGLKIGIYDQWFHHADPDVVTGVSGALGLLEQRGARAVKIVIPELEHLRVAHAVTIVSEMLHAVGGAYDDVPTRRVMNREIRATLAASRFWAAKDYVLAQCIRTRATTHFRRVFRDVDIILTPTTPITAPPITPGALTGGESNLCLATAIMRFSTQANMLGLPAITVPVGTDAKGLPIGCQLIGQPWAEGTLLRIAAVLEQAISAVGKDVPPPLIYLNPLTKEYRGVDVTFS